MLKENCKFDLKVQFLCHWVIINGDRTSLYLPTPMMSVQILWRLKDKNQN